MKNYKKFWLDNPERDAIIETISLVSLIHLKSFYPTESLGKQLERLELGNLITGFCICAKNDIELGLINSLISS